MSDKLTTALQKLAISPVKQDRLASEILFDCVQLTVSRALLRITPTSLQSYLFGTVGHQLFQGVN